MNILPSLFILFAIITSSAALAQDDRKQSSMLSEKEIADLKLMLEEEKMARDVYQLLDEKWDLKVFFNIKQSEQRHLNAVANLLEAYNIAFELKEEAGVFYDPHLQATYNTLIEKGLASKKDALEVGVMIEEQDIADLEQAVSKTNHADIKTVYERLLQASHRHLSAFNRWLEK